MPRHLRDTTLSHTPDAPGLWTVTVSNAAGTTVSEPAVIQVREPVPPGITGLPAEIRIAPAGTARLAPSISGDGPFTYQWFHDGAAVGSPYFSHYAATLPGSYQLTVTGRGGTSTSSIVVVSMAEAPEIITHPASAILADGGRVVLRASVIGRAPFVYQWRRDGVAIPGGTNASFAATKPGAYSVSISNAHGAATSDEALLTLGGTRTVARLVNLSARAWAGWNDARIIAGFVTQPSQEGRAPVLVRAVGPGLEAFEVSSSLAAPVLRLAADEGRPVLEIDVGWDEADSALTNAMRSAGAFDLAPGSRDCAVVVELEAGLYTAGVQGAGNDVGIALIEAYDAAGDDHDRLANLSTRAWVGSGEGVLIAGFALEGSATREILIRAVGPGLSAYAVSSPLSDPEFTLYDGAGRKVTHNDNWDATDAVLAEASERSGAFPLTDAREAAAVLSLNPGAYTIVVEGGRIATGIALVEVYAVSENLP